MSQFVAEALDDIEPHAGGLRPPPSVLSGKGFPAHHGEILRRNADAVVPHAKKDAVLCPPACDADAGLFSRCLPGLHRQLSGFIFHHFPGFPIDLPLHIFHAVVDNLVQHELQPFSVCHDRVALQIYLQGDPPLQKIILVFQRHILYRLSQRDPADQIILLRVAAADVVENLIQLPVNAVQLADIFPVQIPAHQVQGGQRNLYLMNPGLHIIGKLPGFHLPLCDIFQHGFVGRIEHVPEHFPLVEIRFFHHLGNQILFAQLLHHSGQFPVKCPPLQVIQNP